MLRKKPEQHLAELKEMLSKEQEKLKACKDNAAQNQKFEEAADLRKIEKHLGEFIDSLDIIEQSLIKPGRPNG